ncbi:arylesterase [Pelagivirga sediminicola]|uniref:Arylesterase n=1 Tax=Pelagivirga sediminicola TaxID=2170575 RepID=A0A2T7G666_9RHOB|nr:arylesterase [Pelagivirga sediminicola]PVA09925.1 arylesterase [Pelagivirga sediminicola]
MRLTVRDLITYGACHLRGKALLPVLLVASLVAGAPARAADEGELSVMAFGDSLTAGYGVKREDGFVAQLSVWLSENGTPQGVPVRLINASVSGSTTAGGVRRIDWALGDAPDAMIVELGGNDLLRGVDPAETRANLDRILTKATENDIEVLLVGLIAKDNYGPDYRAAFNAIYPELAAKHDTMLKLDFFAGLPEDPAARAPYVQDDGNHPNAKGVALIVQDIGPQVQELIAQSLANRP